MVEKLVNALDEWFSILSRGSDIATELRAGAVTFVTMAYILVVNPQVIMAADPSIPFESVATATAISAIVASLTVGLLGNLPFGMAPGMGLNLYFTFGVVRHDGLSFRVALAAVFFQGLLFLVLAASGVCSTVQQHAPASVKKSITVGLGFFQALAGFQSMGLVVRGDATLLAIGTINWSTVLSLLGLVAIGVLLYFKVRGAILFGIAGVTLLAFLTGLAPLPQEILAAPSLAGTWWEMDFGGYFGAWKRTFPVTLVFLFACLFDTAGVQMAAGEQAGLISNGGVLPGSKTAFASSGAATCIGAALGTSPTIIHNETIAGIGEGGKTGLTAVTVAVCFLLSLPFAPLLKSIPSIATAPPLIIVGMMMMSVSKYIDFEKTEDALPAWVTLTLIPLTCSIATGMIVGILTHIALQAVVRLLKNPQLTTNTDSAADPLTSPQSAA